MVTTNRLPRFIQSADPDHLQAARASLRAPLVRLAREEAVVLFALWLALAVPVACQHGPMGLLFSLSHAASAPHALHGAAPQSSLSTDGSTKGQTPFGLNTHQLRLGLEEVLAIAGGLVTVVLPAPLTVLVSSLVLAVLVVLRRPRAEVASPPLDQPPRLALRLA